MPWLDNVKKQKEADDAARKAKFGGRSDDEVLKDLEEGKNFKRRFEESEAARKRDSEEIGKVTSQFEELKRSLAEAEANRNRQTREPEELANFIEDPEKAFTQRASPIAAATVANSAITARILAQQMLDNNDLATGNKTMDGRLFRAWSMEIDGESRKYQPVQLSSPQAWVGIFYYLKGLHADELRDKEIVKKKYNFLESAAPQGGVPPEKKSEAAEDVLTDEEKHVADKMNVSYDNYLKRKKAMKFVNV